jgi:hypothetical protein
MIILISEMNPSPSGFNFTAKSGEKCPSNPPAKIAASTHK